MTFPAHMAQRRLDGNVARVPILIGTNANEGRSTQYGNNNMTLYLTRALGPNIDPGLLATIKEAYPVGNGSIYATEHDALSAIETDLTSQCGAALVANDTAQIGIPSWRYYVSTCTSP